MSVCFWTNKLAQNMLRCVLFKPARYKNMSWSLLGMGKMSSLCMLWGLRECIGTPDPSRRGRYVISKGPRMSSREQICIDFVICFVTFGKHMLNRSPQTVWNLIVPLNNILVVSWGQEPHISAKSKRNEPFTYEKRRHGGGYPKNWDHIVNYRYKFDCYQNQEMIPRSLRSHWCAYHERLII